MNIANRVVLITGTNRGLGRALFEEALRRGAKRVYAGTRKPLAHPDECVTPLTLDVTDAAQIQAAVEKVESLDILINNAGVAFKDDLSDRALLERHLAVKLFGTLGVTQAFLPLLVSFSGSHRERCVEGGLDPLAAHSGLLDLGRRRVLPTQSLRRLLAVRGVSVHAIVPGSMDTDMSRGFDVPKSSPESVARGILDGVENGEEEIFPDPVSASMAESWRSGSAKALERQFAALVAENVKS